MRPAPKVKTLSEVATISFLRKKTSLPVPEVITYNADLGNILGFEWMLMERVKGQPLREVWHELSWLKKGVLVQNIVSYMIQLYRLKFPSIGSIYAYPLSSGDYHHCEYVVGEKVAHSLSLEDHIQLTLPRGPFPSNKAFVEAEMVFLQHDISKLQHSEDPDDKEQAEGIVPIYTKLLSLIPMLFPVSSTARSKGEEETTLHHSDLSLNNILVSPSGDITGIVDWECTTASPPWHACQLPQFLNGILSPPCKLAHLDPITTRNSFHEKLPEPLTPDRIAEPEAIEFYNEKLQAYELACLRSFFVHEMRRQYPEWVCAYGEEVKKRDVLIAIAYCENDMLWKRIEGWVDFGLQGRGAEDEFGGVVLCVREGLAL